MNAKLYIDKGRPAVELHGATLSDGSKVWNLHFRGGPNATDHDVIGCVSEKAGDEAFALIAKAFEIAAGERPLIL